MLVKKHITFALVFALCAGGAFAQLSGDNGPGGGVGADARFPLDGGMGVPFQAEAGMDMGTGVPGLIVGDPAAAQVSDDDEDADGEAAVAVPRGNVAGVDSAFSIGGGVDMVLVPLQVVTRDTAEYEGNVWLGAGMGRNAVHSGIRTRVNVSANYEDRFGFRTDLWFLFSNDGANLWDGTNPNAMEVRLGDHGNIWMRPADWFRLDVGRIFNFSQSGTVHGHWLSFWSVGMFHGDNIFTSHYSGNIGVLAQFAPPWISGLSVYVFVPHFGMSFRHHARDFDWLACGLLSPGGDLLNSDDEASNRLRAARVFERTWLTVGYRISEQMRARVQFVGANPFGTVNWTGGAGDDRVDVEPYRWRVGISAPRFEAAFAYTLPGSLVVDVGMRAWLPISNWVTDTWSHDVDNPGYIRGGHPGTFWGGLGFGLGVSYLVTEDIRLNFRADGDMLRSWTGTYRGIDTRITNPTRLSFHLWGTYRLVNGMSVLAGFGANYVGRNSVDVGGTNPNDGVLEWDRSDRLRLGGGVSLAIPLFGHSSVSVGLTYRHGTADVRGGEPRTVTVPISFFLHW